MEFANTKHNRKEVLELVTQNLYTFFFIGGNDLRLYVQDL